MNKIDRTEHVKKHLLSAAQTLRDAAAILERDISSIKNIENAAQAANHAITQVAFACANTQAAVATANHWVDDDRQQEIFLANDKASKLMTQLIEATGGDDE